MITNGQSKHLLKISNHALGVALDFLADHNATGTFDYDDDFQAVYDEVKTAYEEGFDAANG